MPLSKQATVVAVTMLTIAGARAPASSARMPRAILRSFVCQRSVDQPARAVSVMAVMRPIPRTKRMALKFQLLARPKGQSSFSLVKGGDLGKWVTPGDPTLGRHPGDVWRFTKPVVDLPAPAFYRFRVSFRWSRAKDVIGLAVRQSSSCHQP